MNRSLAVVVPSLAVPALLAFPAMAPSQSASPSGVELIKAFSPGRDKPLTQTDVTIEQGAWRIRPVVPGVVRLFEVPGSTCESCRLLYRAKVKAKDLSAPAFLEMWVRVPDKGQFFSRGLDQTVAGTVDWVSVEISFFLQEGQRADLVKLNVVFQGDKGSVWVKDLELLRAPSP